METQYNEKQRNYRRIFCKGMLAGAFLAGTFSYALSSLFSPTYVVRSTLSNGQEIVRTVDGFLGQYSTAFIQDPENKNLYLSPGRYQSRLVELAQPKLPYENITGGAK